MAGREPKVTAADKGRRLATSRNGELNMTTTTTKPDAPRPHAATPGDNRGADDVDGNKAGAKTANKAPGPDEPETDTKPKRQP
jgi:hypothetical protein